MIEKIKAILAWSRLSPGEFCEKVQIQRSALTHILSGRNKPSLSLIQKILHVFPEINPDWLLLDKGPMLREQNSTSIFLPQTELFDVNEGTTDNLNQSSSKLTAKQNGENPSEKPTPPSTTNKLIVIYDDGTFEEFIHKSKKQHSTHL